MTTVHQVWGSRDHLNRFAEHLTTHFGIITERVHCIHPSGANITLYGMRDCPTQGWTTYCTYGLSEHDMTSPEGGILNAEYLLTVPNSWCGAIALNPEGPTSWPFFWLHFIAQYPLLHPVHFGMFQTIPGFDPERPLCEHTAFNGFMILPPLNVAREGWKLPVSPYKTISLLALLPLYKDEMDAKLAHGADWLLDKLAEQQLPIRLDPDRPSVLVH